MQTAETILGVIRERGNKGLPLERIYRHLFNPDLYLRAYARIYKNAGAMTPGTTKETVDGMSLAKIDSIIDAVRHERYRWTPVRRVYIEKKNSTKMRPLGIPTWSDKLLQEVIRAILEAYYEPQFSSRSHGFRPGRGCHTALSEIKQTWTGTTWFIEGDISQCFDSLDHQVLLDVVREHIHDNRFLRLIEHLLQAGYLEEWRFNATFSGTPQGGIVSPILANIYLDKLDKFIEAELLPANNRGTQRRHNNAHARLKVKAQQWDKQGRTKEAHALRQEMYRLPSTDPQDPMYRRLRYSRYADDFLLGFTGPRDEAEALKARLGEFLSNTLNLELSETKTLITHARTEAAHFLGYEIKVQSSDHKLDARGRRCVNGIIGLRVPATVIKTKSAAYMARGIPVSLFGRTHDTPYSIVARYQAEFRGLANYYQLAYNRTSLNRLKYVMEQSLVKTLAKKLKLTVRKVYTRYKAIKTTPEGQFKVLRVVVERDGKKPLVAEWAGFSLARRQTAILDDQPKTAWNGRTELLERMLADTCELCGSADNVEVHHVRGLKDLQQKGREARPAWAITMAARQRKTLVVCRNCHKAIHNGKPKAA
jgi:group II intron reverse transcriptase/maturase